MVMAKKTWKVIRKAMNIKPKPDITPNFVRTGTVADGNLKKLNNKTDIANVMNRQFSEMGAKLADKLDPPETHFTDYLLYPNPNHERIILHPTTKSEVDKLIQELDEGKSFLQIPPKIVKWSATLLSPILTKCFNKCLLRGIYPDSLKIARVKPIFKGGNKNETASYRPISILSQFNRIFEKLLRDRLYDFVKDKLYKKQFGFHPKNSTEHPILDLKVVVYSLLVSGNGDKKQAILKQVRNYNI